MAEDTIKAYYNENIEKKAAKLRNFEQYKIYMNTDEENFLVSISKNLHNLRILFDELDQYLQTEVSLNGELSGAERDHSVLMKELERTFDNTNLLGGENGPETINVLENRGVIVNSRSLNADRQNQVNATFVIDKTFAVMENDDVTASNETLASKNFDSQNAASQEDLKSTLARCTSLKRLTDAEFAAVPSYMKGRLKVGQINQLIDKFNEIITAKYVILQKSAKSVADTGTVSGTTGQSAREVKEKRLRYKWQETRETKNERFCVEEDLKDKMTVKESQLFMKQVVQILRHCKRIKENRTGGLLRFVVTS